jgi:hypothetical protein
MKRCAVCHGNNSAMAWQPFGPGEDWKVFCLPGSHYRGFPTIPVCLDCMARINADDDVAFTYRNVPYVVAPLLGKIVESPF